MTLKQALGFLGAAACAAIAFGGCGAAKNAFDDDGGLAPGDDSGTTPSSGSSSSGDGTGPVFVNDSGSSPTPTCNGSGGWGCKVNLNCGSPTTITGKVYDPAGTNPLYNAVVFIPQDASTLPAIEEGTKTCNTCDSPIGDYVVATGTDATGSFTLQNVPTGKGVPLVVQIGKWRRVVKVDTTDCKTTALPKGTARLPRNRNEGSMPQMALLTGALDNLGCFLRKIGIDASEYSAPHAGGRLDIYQGLNAVAGIGTGPGLSGGGAGDCTTSSCPLWATKADLEKYDIVLLACEGGEGNQTKPTSAKQAMHDWLDEGGKVFATHFHYTWFKNSPAADFQGAATWLGSSLGVGSGNYALDTTFPKGMTFKSWLQAVGALSNGTIPLSGVATSVSGVKAPTSRWVYDSGNSDTKYLSFGTPIGGVKVDAGEQTSDKYCGKAVFSDLHAGGAPSGDIPSSCTDTTLTQQEEALEFLFFDLAACVQDDTMPVQTIPPAK